MANIEKEMQDVCQEFGYETKMDFISAQAGGKDPFAKFRKKEKEDAP